MKKIMKCNNAVVLLVLLLAILVSACGSTSEKSTSPASVSSSATTAGMGRCTTCHTGVTSDWLASKHANLGSGGTLDSPGSPTMAQITTGACTSCHDPNGDSAGLRANYTGNIARPVVGCEACHGPGSEHVAAGGTGPIGFANATAGVIGTTSTVNVSAQFLTCTKCHELLSPTDPANAAVTAAHDVGGSDPLVVASGANPNTNSITDTHFAVAQASGPAAGYVMDFSSEKVCTNCHNPHKNADINRQWAMSLKADKRSSGVWANNNWSTRPYCQRCHTTSGFIALSDAMTVGNADLVSQVIRGTLSTSPVPSAATWKPEMLLCTACHTDNKGTVRNPGAFTADYSYSFYSAAPINYAVASHTYPDTGSSNVCMPCHTGRQGGDSIKNLNIGAVTVWNFSNNTVLGNHNMQAGGMMFRGVGYNYADRDYSNPPQFMHDKIGMSVSTPASGTNGPCIRCHMTSPDGTSNHLFPLFSSTTTTVNGIARIVITGNPFGICSTCHGPNPTVVLDLISQSKNNYIDAQSALAKAMESAGIYRRGTSFYRARDSQLISAGAVTVFNGGTLVLGFKTN